MFNNNAENNTWREDKIKHDRTTKCKCHKGFRGLRRSEVRFNFSCNLIGNHPQSLTALTLDRWASESTFLEKGCSNKPVSYPICYGEKREIEIFCPSCLR